MDKIFYVSAIVSTMLLAQCSKKHYKTPHPVARDQGLELNRIEAIQPSIVKAKSAIGPITVPFHFKILASIVADLSIEELGQRLAQYVVDLNALLRDTNRRLSFDPATNIHLLDAVPQNSFCQPIPEDIAYGALIDASGFSFSHGGTSGCNRGDGIITSFGYRWTKIYDPSLLQNGEADFRDYYSNQISALIHELGHQHGLALSEYYNLCTLFDLSGIEPDLTARCATNPSGPYWGNRQLVLSDPMLKRPQYQSRQEFIDGVRFSPMSVKLFNEAIDGVTSPRHCPIKPTSCFPARIISNNTIPVSVKIYEGGQQLTGVPCNVKIFKSKTYNGEITETSDYNTENGAINFDWSGFMSNLNHIRLAKVNCDGFRPGGDWLSLFDLQAAAIMPNGGVEQDFRYPGEWKIQMVRIPPEFINVKINDFIEDPEPIGSGPLPTTWRQQRSLINNMTVELSVELSTDDYSLNLIHHDLDGNSARLPVSDERITQVGKLLIIDFVEAPLPDGSFDVELQVAQGGSNHPVVTILYEGTAANRLCQLKGDFNGDTGVSVFDFVAFSYWFGHSNVVAPSYMDLNNDGGVSVFDFVIFSGNFGVSAFGR